MRVFAVGDLNIDLFVYTKNKPIYGIEQKIDFFDITIGGNAANFAFALSALGVKTNLISCIGDDFFSSYLRSELKKSKTTVNLFTSNKKNGVSIIFVGKDGERAIMSSKGALLDLDCGKISKVLLPKLRKNDVVFFGGFFHMPMLKLGFKELLKKIKDKEVKVFFDCCYDEYENWRIPGLEYIDILFLNEIELKKLTKIKDIFKAAKSLLDRGVGSVVLKKGKKGSSFFSKRFQVSQEALDIKVVNTTAAGDFFNAGFVYGFLNNYNEKTCLACGNYIASQKIKYYGYRTTRKSDLEKYLDNINCAQIMIFKDYKKLSKFVVDEIVAQLKNKPDSVFSFAAGKTPLLAYKIITKYYKEKKVDFSKAYLVQLDEYLNAREKDSFTKYFEDNLIAKTNFDRERIFFFSSKKDKVNKDIQKVKTFLRNKCLDFVILGIGKNGHIAFNNPGSSFSSDVRKVVLLHDALYKEAVTLGIKNILKARKIFLLANGFEKAEAIKNSFMNKPSKKYPASALQKHKNCYVLLDCEAANLLKAFSKQILDSKYTNVDSAP